MQVLNKVFSLVLILTTVLSAQAQIGGNSVYDFLNLSSSARVTAVGGNLITIKDDDLSLAYHNPALLNPLMHHRVVASHRVLFDGINHGYFAYARDLDMIATFQAGIQYVTYGNFSRRSETGQDLGTFNAGELAINLGAARQFDRYSYGTNVKLIYSKLDDYTSVGMAFDFGLTYNDTAKNFTASLVFKNAGFQFSPYTKEEGQEITPMEIQLGFSKRLKYVPFRISVVMHNIENWGLRFDDPNAQEGGLLFEEEDTTSSGGGAGDVFDEIARHFNVGGEIYLGKAFRVGFGYNHQRRQELAVSTSKGLAGFSFGFGLLIKQFQFNFARSRYHVGNAANHFTMQINLGGFKQKREAKGSAPAAAPVKKEKKKKNETE